MPSERVQEMADKLSELSPAAAGELAKTLAKLWGVSIDRPTGPAIQQPAEQVQAAPEQTEFDVILTGFDEAKKIAVVREVRTITQLGLKEAMALVNEAPNQLKTAVSKDEADRIKATIEGAGGKVEVK